MPDLLGAWLTGVAVAEVTNASTTGLLDATTRTWAVDLAERLGIDAGLLPPLRDAGQLLWAADASLPELWGAEQQDAAAEAAFADDQPRVDVRF